MVESFSNSPKVNQVVSNGAEIQNEVFHAPASILYPSCDLIHTKCLVSCLTRSESSIGVDYHK